MKILTFILMILPAITFAKAGPRVGGNGGDPIAAEYKYIAEKMLDRLRFEYPQGMQMVNLDALEEKVRTARVESTDDRLFEDGIEKSALNYRDLNLIRVNRSRWMSESDPRRIAANVFHEYAGLVDDSDKSDQISRYFLSDAPLSYAIVMATGERAYGPWICYLKLIEDLILASTSSVTEADQEKILRNYFVKSYEPLPGFNYKYQISVSKYRDFNDSDPLVLIRTMQTILKREMNLDKDSGAMQIAATVVRGYARDGLPQECRPILKIDQATGFVVGIGRQ